MANVGIVQSVTGTVIAVAEDGTERVLRVGDSVAENEKIITKGGTIAIAFADGTTMDLGNDSSIVLNDDVRNQEAEGVTSQRRSDAEDEVAALQEALTNNPNFDPANLPATAAGTAAGGGAGNNGHSLVSVDYLNPDAPVEAGFDTTGINTEFLQGDEELPPLIEEPEIPALSLSDAVVTEGDASSNGVAFGGGAMAQTISVQVGDVLTLDWNFLSGDGGYYNDYGFIVIDGQVFELSDANDANDLGGSTGYQTFTYTFEQSGDVVIGLGVTDVGDEIVDSTLLVDNIAINGSLVDSFESDLSAWDTLGDVSIDGTQQVLITSAGDDNVAAIEGLFGLTDDALSIAVDPEPVIAIFTVSLNQVSDLDVSVSFTTADGTAISGGSGVDANDYGTATGTVIIPAGSLSSTIEVTVLGDIVVEGDEGFLVQLSGATNAVLPTSEETGTGTILDNDTVEFSIYGIGEYQYDQDEGFDTQKGPSHTFVNEGQVAEYTVSYDGVLADGVQATVVFDTANGTVVGFDAVEGVDFDESTGT